MKYIFVCKKVDIEWEIIIVFEMRKLVKKLSWEGNFIRINYSCYDIFIFIVIKILINNLFM